MRTFALFFGLLAALVVVLCLRPPAERSASAAWREEVRVSDVRNPARSLIDDAHEWTWVPTRPAAAGRKESAATGPILLRRERASGAVVGRYVMADEKDGTIDIMWTTTRPAVSTPGWFRFTWSPESRTGMGTRIRPIEERRPVF